MGCVPQDEDCESDEIPRHSVTVSAFEMTETEITQAQYVAIIGSNPSRFHNCPDCPVEQVDWYDAKVFCEAVGGRLPSEAEWEYAARAITTTIFYCGDNPSCLDSIACWNTNIPCPVGQKTANDFGLYNMLGNVCEWTEDCWHDNYTGVPTTGSVWAGVDCSYRVLRGGGWYLDAETIRASNRAGNKPGNPNDIDGFRCSRDEN